MSFVSRLRMANMFPVKSDLGNARIPLNNEDDMNEVIEAGKRLALFDRNVLSGGDRLRSIGDSGRINSLPPIKEPKRFGGVVGPVSNPGADILNRSKTSAENIYQGYKQPLNRPVEGPSNDEMHYQRYLDNALKQKTVDSTIGQNERKLSNEERRLDQADTRIDNTNDATNRRLDVLEGGAKLKQDLAIDKQNELNTQKNLRRESQKTKATEGLALIDELMDSTTGQLKPDTQTATGWSANIPFQEMIPFGRGTSAATGNAKINKLQGMLTLDLIKELKEQSKTGATGFGALNLRELGVLENSASMLSKKNMDEREFAKELGNIKDRLNMILRDESSSQSNGDGGNGRIRVKNKLTGQMGTISAGAFNPEKYDRVQ